jgi:uncharacterized delta-60 repeat protein
MMSGQPSRGPRILIPLVFVAALLLGFLLAFPAAADLTPAVLDTGFDTGTGPDSDVYAAALQPDGRVLIGGSFSTIDSQARSRVARLEADGSLDSTFAPGAFTGGAVPVVWDLARQPDGKVLVAGSFTAVGGQARTAIARLNDDGSLDTTFVPDAITGGVASVLAVALQPDGKVLIGGVFTQVDGQSRNGIARLNADGSLDTGFDPGTGANNDVNAVALEADGRVLVGGAFLTVNGQSRPFLARLNSNGSLAPALAAQPSSTVRSLAIQPDDRILLGGDFSQVGGTPRVRIARLNASGSLDTTFDTSTAGPDAPVRAIALQPDGAVLIGGDFLNVGTAGRGRFARLSTDGSLDTAHDPGAGASAEVYDIVAQPIDSKALLGGRFSTVDGISRPRIARTNADGSVDIAFDYSQGTNSQILDMDLQPDGKLLIGGNFTKFGGVDRRRVARLRADGTLDGSFDTSAAGPDANVQAVAVQEDGKILIGGAFTAFGAVPISNTARLESDGSLDTTYSPDPMSGSAQIMTLAIQEDGKILIGGSFTKVNNIIRRRIARLESDGSLDTGFDSGEGAEGGVSFTSVRDLAVQPDGKVLVGGDFYTIDDLPRRSVARLESDGSVDLGFDPGDGANEKIHALAVQPDGKVLVGGEFTVFDGASLTYVARLNSDGSLDGSFAPGIITDTTSTERTARVNALVLQPDGRVIIGGKFTEVDGVEADRIARLNADGSLDLTFDTSNAASGNVTGLLLQPDGKALVEGGFSLYAGHAVEGLVRINAMTAPTFNGAAPEPAVVGDPYSHTFTTLGVPAPLVRLSDGALPPGLELDSASGILSGVPTTRAPYDFTLTAYNYVTPSAHQAFSLRILGETQTELVSLPPSQANQPVLVEYAVFSPWGTPTGDVNVVGVMASTTSGFGTGPASRLAVSCTATVSEGGCELTFPTPGDWLVYAEYLGDQDFAGSQSAPAELVVHEARFSVYLPVVLRDP